MPTLSGIYLYNMAQVPSGQKFHTVPSNVQTVERGSALANSQREIYTMQDIVDTTRPYKVYTALLTQSGVDDPKYTQSGGLDIGVTYYIDDNAGSPDFTNVGAPNNNVGTYFVATGTTPTSWGEAGLSYNSGAPVATVLENTIGNIWFTYDDIGGYSVNSDGLFTLNKTYFQDVVLNNAPTFLIVNISNDNNIELTTGGNDGELLQTPIEIRVYN
jgi:hypothetical protein